MAEQTTAEKAQATAQKAIYAAIGAPARATKVMGEAISDRIADATARMTERRSKAIKEFRAEFDAWAKEGEDLVNRFQDRSMVEDIASRANVDQFQEQVGKLRHQLEDMLETWRANFLPERSDAVKAVEKVEIVADKVEVKKPAAKKAPATKKAPAKKPAAKATTTAKKAPAKKAPAKKPATAAKK